MKQRPTSTVDESTIAVEVLSEPERLLERARQLVHGAPAGVDLTIVVSMGSEVDSITVQISTDAPLEKRCDLVDWFAKKLGIVGCKGLPRCNASGYASYMASAEMGTNRKTYVDVFTPIAKAA